MALGREIRQGLFDEVLVLMGGHLPESVYRLLAEHGVGLFSDDSFAGLFNRSPVVPITGNQAVPRPWLNTAQTGHIALAGDTAISGEPCGHNPRARGLLCKV